MYMLYTIFSVGSGPYKTRKGVGGGGGWGGGTRASYCGPINSFVVQKISVFVVIILTLCFT